jgi:NAD(P)H-binding
MRSYSFSDEESESSATLEQSSILVVGASSKTGVECIHQLSEHPSKPLIHAFCEHLSELDEEVAKLCSTIFEGSVRHAIDIEEALSENGANWVVLCGDASEDSFLTGRQINIRTVSAKNTAQVLSQPRFQSVRVLVVSRIGAGTTSMKFGLRGKLCQLKGRQFLLDNAGQEKAVRPIWNRTTVVRTTMLTDSATTSSRRIVELSDHDKIPTLSTERADLASCIVDEICARPIPVGNRVVNVTSVKL